MFKINFIVNFPIIKISEALVQTFLCDGNITVTRKQFSSISSV